MINKLQANFQLNNNKLCLQIENNKYSYADVALRIASIQNILASFTEKDIVGITAENSVDTYASIIACWLSGKGFVPIHPKYPVERNEKIMKQAEIDLILSSAKEWDNFIPDNNSVKVKQNSLPEAKQGNILINDTSPEQIFCILFTSGSTGEPKGVPYTLKSIASTLDAFFALDYNLTVNDRFLQMFEFTFDMSMLSYLPAFYLGASIYTVGFDKIRYLEALKAMQKYKITFAMMVPSTLALLRPYFPKIQLQHLKYSLLGGEPFPKDLATEWSKCIPNSTIVNISGPTEITMACMGYTLDKKPENNESYNGILAFGYPWKNTKAILVDENLNIVDEGITGELCFSGDHVMQGYLNLPELNDRVFFHKEINGKQQRFYRTGDMAFIKNGIFYTCGRKDLQVKIQGHKVELEEIEFVTKKLLNNPNVFALAGLTAQGAQEIQLVISATNLDQASVKDQLRSKLPPYMMPNSIKFVNKLPYNENGKIDRRALKNLFE